MICAVAAHHHLAIFTTDKDFRMFANHLPITLYEPGLLNDGGGSRKAKRKHK